MPARAASRPVVEGVAIDVDATLVATFDIWAASLAEGWNGQPSLLEYMCRSRGYVNPDGSPRLGFDLKRIKEPGYVDELARAESAKPGDPILFEKGTLAHDIRAYAMEVYGETKDRTPFEIIYNEPERMLDAFPFLNPDHQRLSPAERDAMRKADAEAVLRVNQQRESLTRFLPGAVDMFADLYKAGTPPVILSNGTSSAVKQRIAQAAHNAQAAFDTRLARDPELAARLAADPALKGRSDPTVISLYRASLSVADPLTTASVEGRRGTPVPVSDPGSARYFEEFAAKHQTVPKGAHKPNTGGFEMAMSLSRVTRKDRMAMIGDSHEDIMTALNMADVGEPKGVPARAALQLQGAKMSQEALALNSLVAFWGYHIGAEHTVRHLDAFLSEKPALAKSGPPWETLENGLADLSGRFQFTPPGGTAQRRLHMRPEIAAGAGRQVAT